MTKDQLTKFLEYLLQDNVVYGPVQKGSVLEVEKIAQPADLVLNGCLTDHSWKKVFLPPCEKLFDYQGAKLNEVSDDYPQQVAFGLTTFDLKALNLFHHVYEKDPYYQRRKRNTLIIGQSVAPEQDAKTFKVFSEKLEEDILEHLEFDIFFEQRGDSFRVMTGSEDGQEVLDKFGFSNYEHIQFAGPIKETGLGERTLAIKDQLKNHHDQKIWDELGKKCIECGKCTIACPTCYCFRIDDEAVLTEGEGERTRCWDSCFYREFSEVAGDHVFLENTAQRIHFWYYHKFVRIPEQYGLPGCVGCGRCTRTCPVGIDINETLQKIVDSDPVGAL
ncbi:MAG: 4Fe-4S dicluster domain-containing protein [Parcubacteria group bacterium]|nr:4Fe-4S dicluster domain-containing protein [Parcubacteria group bacterium]